MDSTHVEEWGRRASAAVKRARLEHSGGAMPWWNGGTKLVAGVAPAPGAAAPAAGAVPRPGPLPLAPAAGGRTAKAVAAHPVVTSSAGSLGGAQPNGLWPATHMALESDRALCDTRAKHILDSAGVRTLTGEEVEFMVRFVHQWKGVDAHGNVLVPSRPLMDTPPGDPHNGASRACLRSSAEAWQR